MHRNINYHLLNWKNSKHRKVLLIRGARQVGKTYSIRELGKSFSSYLEVNFLETSEVSQFFKTGNLSPQSIIEKLQIFYGQNIIPGETLLFFDETQACPEALTALRFFYEKFPELHVIATGSLLEFTLQDIPSFGVGRIESMFMYPLSFEEFLIANSNNNLVNLLFKASPNNPIDEIFHKKITELFRIYCILGGLPQVIQTYLDTNNVNECLQIIDDLILGYEDDFSKYKTRISHEKLRTLLTASAKQAGSKFIYSKIIPGSNISGYDSGLRLLELAGLVYRVQKTSANGIPLGSEVNNKSFKIIPFDLGIYNRLLKLNISETLIKDNIKFINSGALAEIICGLEIIANGSPRQRPALFYWSREVRGANSEVDYVFEYNNQVIPIEVKAGTKGQMQSMYFFLIEKNKNLGIRTSLENFSHFKNPNNLSKIEVVPLYAIGKYLHSKDNSINQ